MTEKCSETAKNEVKEEKKTEKSRKSTYEVISEYGSSASK